MKADDRFKDDLLREFIDPGQIEKAPEGFSPKLMSLVYLEKRSVRNEKSIKVPLISGLITVLFIAAALFLPESSFPVRLNLPEIDLVKLPDLNYGTEIPGIMMPVIAGIILLVVFDAILKGLFNKRRLQD